MTDLLLVVPSRGRPGKLLGMLAACMGLSEADTAYAVCYDDDDPVADGYQHLEQIFAPAPEVTWHHGPRNSVSGWTNAIAVPAAGQFEALGSFSDDHMPRTQGWDRLLLEALDGCGISYGDDLYQGATLPTAAVVSSSIVSALGWLAEPHMSHFYIDNVWSLVGGGAGCLAYRPDVVIEHLHPAGLKAENDSTYGESAALWEPDQLAFERWLAERKDADIATVTALAAARKATA